MKNEAKYRLVILTTHFGTNFSGGSTATHEIFFRMQHRFSEIIVVCNQLGDHSFENVTFCVYRNFIRAIRILRSFEKDRTVFYGDFYNSIWFVWLRISFYFTYHDNWPEQASVSIYDRIRALIKITIYKSIFRKAEKVIAVSEFKLPFVKEYHPDAVLIRNGFSRARKKTSIHRIKVFRIIMVGNIDKRKYLMAIPLLKLLSKDRNIMVFIFGNKNDRKMVKKIRNISNVRIMGFVQDINYSNYNLFLHTSIIENLPMSVCEALYHKLPVIAFRVGGIPEIVNCTNGILIEPYHINQMHKSILKVKNKKHTFSFKENDLKEYSWDLASKKYMEVITI